MIFKIAILIKMPLKLPWPFPALLGEWLILFFFPSYTMIK